MKKQYIKPEAVEVKLTLFGSVLGGDPYIKPASDDTKGFGARKINVWDDEEEEIEDSMWK